jgi:hypothetical protein
MGPVPWQTYIVGYYSVPFGWQYSPQHPVLTHSSSLHVCTYNSEVRRDISHIFASYTQKLSSNIRISAPGGKVKENIWNSNTASSLKTELNLLQSLDFTLSENWNLASGVVLFNLNVPVFWLPPALSSAVPAAINSQRAGYQSLVLDEYAIVLIQRTPNSRDRLEKEKKTFPTFYGTERFLSVYVNMTISLASRIQSESMLSFFTEDMKFERILSIKSFDLVLN